MKYVYEDLESSQFETLVVEICKKLFGVSVQGFAPGRDQGRDAKFVGVAKLHPSKAAPWEGTTIIQAKHSNGGYRSCSESDFFSESSDNTVIGKEVPRVQALKATGQLDHYILFTNRRLTAQTESEIRQHLASQCNLPEVSIYLCGVEKLEDLLRTFPDIPDRVRLDPVDSPLIVAPEDLAEIIQALGKIKNQLKGSPYAPPTPRTPYEEKNRLNDLCPDYAEEWRKRYLEESGQIEKFLAAPEKFELMQTYESVIEEFQMKIISKRKDHQSFSSLLEYLFDLLFGRDPILRKQGNKRLVRSIMFYMYWNCDIGKDANA